MADIIIGDGQECLSCKRCTCSSDARSRIDVPRNLKTVRHSRFHTLTTVLSIYGMDRKHV